MEAVRAFTRGASEDVILKEPALERLRRMLLGQSQAFYERLRQSLEGETDPASRAALAEALFDAGMLYGKVDAPQKSLDAHNAALALRGALLREQPGDPGARRDVGRSHLALASLLRSLARLQEAQAEVRKARGLLRPLAAERPRDGGIRRLEAECEALDGFVIIDDSRLAEGIAVLGRARAMYEKLINDDPPYTLPTEADGATEYRRGLAEVLDRIATSFHEVGERADKSLKVRQEQRKNLKTLTNSKFVNDQDWRLLASCYASAHGYLSEEEPPDDPRDREESRRIFQRLATEYPTVTSYKVYLAQCLCNDVYLNDPDRTKRRGQISSALAMLQSLSRDQKYAHDAVGVEALCELCLAEYDRRVGRLEEAARHLDRVVAIYEEAIRDSPGSFKYQQQLVAYLFDVALCEFSIGHAERALRSVRRLIELAVPVLRHRPELRRIRGYHMAGSLVEAFLLVKSNRPAEAVQAVERAEASLELIKPPLFDYEQFGLGTIHAFWYLLGRPSSPGRPAEPPGLRDHSNRAVAEITRAVQGRFVFPTTVEMVAQLLPDRPELQLLVMDQHFPGDPFVPAPDAKDDDPSVEVGGASP
jgi:tetratricopeptide (TPR) repeat protein